MDEWFALARIEDALFAGLGGRVANKSGWQAAEPMTEAFAAAELASQRPSEGRPNNSPPEAKS